MRRVAVRARCFVLASVVLAVQLHVVVGGAALRWGVVSMLFGVALWNVAHRAPLVGSKLMRSGSLGAIALYVLVLLVTLWRGAGEGMVGGYAGAAQVGVAALAVVAVVLTTLSTAVDDRDLRAYVAAASLSPGVFVLGAVVLWGLGFQGATATAEGSATVLGMLGVSFERVAFPLVSGTNSLGVLAAAGLASSALVRPAELGSSVKALRAGVLVACSFALLAADTRAAILFAAVIVGWAFSRTRLPGRSAAIVVIFSPVLVRAALSATAGASESLSRESGDFVSGTNRTFIWDAVWTEITRSFESFTLGHGAGGQITSGASLHYAYLFRGADDPSRFSAHSLSLQTMLDGGVIALAVTAFLAGYSLSVLRRWRDSWDRRPLALAAGLSVLFLCGSTEATPSYLAPETLWCVLVLAGAGCALHGLRPSPVARTRGPRQSGEAHYRQEEAHPAS